MNLICCWCCCHHCHHLSLKMDVTSNGIPRLLVNWPNQSWIIRISRQFHFHFIVFILLFALYLLSFIVYFECDCSKNKIIWIFEDRQQYLNLLGIQKRIKRTYLGTRYGPQTRTIFQYDIWFSKLYTVATKNAHFHGFRYDYCSISTNHSYYFSRHSGTRLSEFATHMNKSFYPFASIALFKITIINFYFYNIWYIYIFRN